MGIEGTIASIEYDPNRNARIALVHYEDGEKRYILHPNNIKVGDKIMAGSRAPLNIGNTLPLEEISLGTSIHNIELIPKRGGQIVRAGGTSAKILAKEGNYIPLRFPSKEIRLVRKECFATIGEVSNNDAFLVQSGKAGRTRPLTPWGKPALGMKTRKRKKLSDAYILRRR